MQHKLSEVHPAAILGKNVAVGSFSSIQADVIIGDGTIVGPHATIMSGSRIGKNCQIFPGAVIGASAQDKKKIGRKTYVEIGDHTVIREFVTLNKGTFHNTHIGSHVLLMAYVHVAHDCIVQDHVIVANAAQLAGHVQLQHHAVIGGMAAIHQCMSVGAYSMVASKSIVRKDVPPFIKVAREPLKYCGINTVALQRHDFTAEQCARIHQIYYYIYHSKLLLTTALRKIDQQIGTYKEAEIILSFICNSKNGIVKKVDTI